MTGFLVARFFASKWQDSVPVMLILCHLLVSDKILLVAKSLQVTVVSDKVLCLRQGSLSMTVQVLCQSVARFSLSGEVGHSSSV